MKKALNIGMCLLLGLSVFPLAMSAEASMTSSTAQTISVLSNPTVSGAPAVPVDFATTANDGSVELSWTAVPGAASYSLKRGDTLGGPYTALTSGLTSTTYKDTTVTNGKVYYYVVSAVNSNGESPPTDELIVSPARVVTVAQDGSGDFTNVTNALATIPAN
ncbi:hypothetical protein AB4Z22_21710, partial [Paenibacillus sp. TAF58]